MLEEFDVQREIAALPQWLQNAVASANDIRPATDELPPPTAAAYRHDPAWPLLLDAALVPSFLPRELGPSSLAGDARLAAESALLDFAERTYDSSGARWSLSRRVRAEILDAAVATSELAEAVARTEARAGSDPVTHALLMLVQGKARDWRDERRMQALESLHFAIGLLSSTKRYTLPSLPDLERRMELQRLLAPFRRMTGMTTSTPGGPETVRTDDRFFGRAEEREKLRAYVDVVGAEGRFESLRRIGRNLRRAFTGRKPLAVWGGGGIGKTTLIAKFMLEHAQAAERVNYPFAYLDFDRATISPRNRGGLLIEMSLQVSAQFEELTGPMLELRNEIRETSHRLEAAADRETISYLDRHIATFRHLIDEHLAAGEGLLTRKRPFLLVFDTFELVQASDHDVAAMEELVTALSGDEGKAWPRLRLIIAGRVMPESRDENDALQEFLGGVESIPLGPLDVPGSIDMLIAETTDLGAPIGRKLAGQLVATMAKAAGRPGEGIQPLRLRLVGELFRGKSDGDALARSLIEELSDPDAASSEAGHLLIDGILVRRILGAVGDDRVRALADPGLVVRRITPAIIREVMARGTPAPVKRDRKLVYEDGKDRTDFKPWTLEIDEAKEIYAAFAREVTLVTMDGDALRHRQDVRLEMLPLIKARRPRRFQQLHELAYKHYRYLLKHRPTDPVLAREAIYHALWLQLPLETVDELWQTQSSSFDSRVDPSEFSPDSPAAIYLRAKNAAALRPDEIRLLPPTLAFQWLKARSPALLQETDVNASVASVQAVAGESFQNLRDLGLAATVARLLFRAGDWDQAYALASRFHEPGAAMQSSRPTDAVLGAELGFHQVGLVSLLRTEAVVAAKTPGTRESLERVAALARQVPDPVCQVEVLAHAALGMRGMPGAEALAPMLVETIAPVAVGVRPTQWRNEIRVLRLFLLTAPEPPLDLLSIYLESIERLPRERALAPDVARLLDGLFAGTDEAPRVQELAKQLDPGSGSYPELLGQLDVFWRRAPFMKVVGERPDLLPAFLRCVAFDHADWIQPLTASLEREPASEIAVMMKRLDEARVLSRVPESRRTPRTIVHSAIDDGRLLALAAVLAGRDPGAASSEQHAGPPAPGPFPTKAREIAASLLGWHQRLTSGIAGPPTSPMGGAAPR